MLPPGVSPAGTAAFAAMYFLPGLEKAPTPHCKIALYPGFHFVRDLREIHFHPKTLFDATMSARAMRRGIFELSPPVNRLRERRRKNPNDNNPVYFHWLWKCRRVWTRYGAIEVEELAPRLRFGGDDNYEAIIDVLECDKLDKVSVQLGPYDLLVYCPYYHTGAIDNAEDDVARVMRVLNNFNADRKLLVARSPYDYWSRRLEPALNHEGIAFLASANARGLGDGSIRFHIVDQLIDLTEAIALQTAIRKSKKKGVFDRMVYSDLRSALRYFLIGVDPGRDPELVQENIGRLGAAAQILGFDLSTAAGKIISKIKETAENGGYKTKKDFLISLSPGQGHEIWVTKDSDKRTISDLKAERGLEFSIRMTNRWIAAGTRSQGASVILIRIDREGDLDLVSYLQANDEVIMSAWEAVIRDEMIMQTWERSERWRETASLKLGVPKAVTGKCSDPVLELADFLETHVTKETKVLSPKTQQTPPAETAESWWNDYDVYPILEPELRREGIGRGGSDAVSCIELAFDGSLGMFVRKDSEIQVLKTDVEGEDEFESIAVSNLMDGDTVLLFRDAERNSIFDILIDQLERSSRYGEDASVVKAWKERLREAFIKSGMTVAEVRNAFIKAGQTPDPVTIRSWIMGPTMAPLRCENMVLLANTLDISGLDLHTIFGSVQKLRVISRVIGRGLNQLIIRRDLEGIDGDLRIALDSSGIDLEEILSAVEARRVVGISKTPIAITPCHVGKLFLRG